MRYYKYLIPLVVAFTFISTPALEARSSFFFGLNLNLIPQLLAPAPRPVAVYAPPPPVYYYAPPVYYVEPAPVYVVPGEYYYYY
ncbi:MAG: hypothetical protein WC222_07990 [Parachlamydiales bacterium]|jgi:hypothetical protein